MFAGLALGSAEIKDRSIAEVVTSTLKRAVLKCMMQEHMLYLAKARRTSGFSLPAL